MNKLSKVSTAKKILLIGLGILALGIVVLALSLPQSLTFHNHCDIMTVLSTYQTWALPK